MRPRRRDVDLEIWGRVCLSDAESEKEEERELRRRTRHGEGAKRRRDLLSIGRGRPLGRRPVDLDDLHVGVGVGADILR